MRIRRATRTLAAFGLYGAVSLALFGRDVLAHPGSRVVGDEGADKAFYMWSLEWWPRALARGHNPPATSRCE